MQPILTKNRDLVEDLVLETQAHLAHFFEHIDLASLREVVDHLHQLTGRVFLTGVGKSGIVAKKVAMTMNSCGIKAGFLSPLNALHGDIGILEANDCLIMLSKSGETDELLNLCPAARNKGASLIAVVSTKECRLAKACDLTVFLPVAKELCPFDLAPTTSVVVQLLFGDLVAIALMRLKSCTIDTFVANHPAGRIGKRLTLKVSDLMLRGQSLPICRRGEKLVDILVELSNKKCGCIFIVDEDLKIEGIFTDGDLRRSLQKHGADALSLSIGVLMTPNPRRIEATALAYDAMKQMEANQKGAITALAVSEDDRLIGLIRLHDIIQSGL